MTTEILRPNARFLYLDLEKGKDVLDLLSLIDQFVTTSKNHFYAHDFCVLEFREQRKIIGRDIIGPYTGDGSFPDPLKCRDIKAFKSIKIEVDLDILSLSADKIENIASDMMHQYGNGEGNWELWWSLKGEENPFFLF